MSGEQIEFLAVPGAEHPLRLDRAPDGRLLRLSGAGRLYVDATAPDRTVFTDLASVDTVFLPNGFVRRVRAGAARWSERYAWDRLGRLVHVDGVDIGYDDGGRVIAGRGADGNRDGDWHYGYAGDHLVVIAGPFGLRHIVRADDGRALGWREEGRVGSIAYDVAGRRAGIAPPPAAWRFDPLGRLVAILGPDGGVARTFLWDRWHCLGALDGPPGAKLAEIYSLDPTGTPVRRVSEAGVDRFPRDAFGEALLGARVPGLFGGAVHAGLVHLPLRRLDPRIGAFDAPDPINGEAGDPRRAKGWTGPLPVELPAAGPYTVCRNNPVSLADPTGGISDLWWLIPSALTWSISNTIGSLLGMWLNLQFSPIGWIVSAATGHDPFDLEWVAANNYDSFALRTDGFLAAPDHAFTYQFMMSADKKQITDLEDARLFAPAAEFNPKLYASMLRCAPTGKTSLLLSGQRATPNGAAVISWTRAGGEAVRAFPGSRVPVFPTGGMHFGAVQRGLHQGPAKMIELAPSGTVLTAAIGDFAAVTIPGTGLGLAEGAAFALTDPAGVLTAGRVLAVHEAAGSTMLRTDAVLAGLASGPLKLDGLSAPSTEPLTPVAGHDHLLAITGSSLDYTPAISVVRLSRGGPALGAAGVSALEARLSLDAPAPATLAAGAIVRLAAATGTFDAKLGPGPADFTIVTGATLAVGDAVVVGPAATGIAAIVTLVAAASVTLDRDLTTLGPADTAVTWARLAPGGELGKLTAAPDASAELAYAPGAPGIAPAGGFISLQGAPAAARRVTGRVYDAIVLAEALPDANPAAFTVDRFRRTAPTVVGSLASNAATFALSGAAPANTTALQVVAFPGPAPVTGATLAANVTVAAGVATTTVSAGAGPAALRPGEAVALVPVAGGAAVPAQIRSLRLTVTLDRRLPFSGGTVEAALLTADTLVYTAERLGDRVLRVRPLVLAARLDMPRFVAGDLVQVDFPVNNRRLFRIVDVLGATITGDIDAPAIPAGTGGITVRRLFAADPATGSARLGLNGADAGGAQIAFDVWRPSHFPDQRIVAIIDGATTRAAQVTAIDQPLAMNLAGADAVGGVQNVVALTGSALFTADFTRDGQTLRVTDAAAATALAGMASAIVIPWLDTAETVAGEVHPGSVRVPEDHENATLELTRRNAVIDHELTHTLQSAKWGPLLLTAFPMWAIELAADLTAAGGPDFTPYAGATLAEGKLTASDAALLEAGGKVQVAQNRRAVLIDLGGAVDGAVANLPDAARSQLSAAGITAGPVMLRKPLGGAGTETLEWFTNIGQLLTVGGLLNNITLASWGGIAALITLGVSAIRRATRARSTMTLQADQKTLLLNPVTSLEGLGQGVLVAVKSGDAIVVRAVETLSATSAVLGAPTPKFSTVTPPAPVDVEVSIYSPGARLFGLRDYFIAAMPDPNQPARLIFSGFGGKPELAVHDRIEVRSASGAAQRTLVTRIDGDAIEFADPLLPSNTEANEFLVGKIASQDPTGWLDSWLLDELNIGWLQYAYDPWGHILARNMPDRSNIAGQVFARSAKYLFGTQSWGIPPLGYFWFDNAFRRSTAQRSRMEQEASRKSGDTYCPLGTLHGDVAVIGDVARYWMTLSGGTRDGSGVDNGGLVMPNLQDAPGVALIQGPTLTMPASTPAVPFPLFATNATGDLAGIAPGAWVPVSAHLERSAGFNLAFTRPPAAGATYRVTSTGVSGIPDAIDAQSDGAATIFFDRAPADVTVVAAGVPVAENVPLDVIPFQRITFTVAPDGARVYRVTVGQPGARFDAANRTLTARGGLGEEDVEISRFHAYDTATGKFASGIGPFHLPADLDIAVRRFLARIIDALPLRAPHTPGTATFDHRDPAAATAKPGDTLFLLVPAPIDTAAPIAVFAGVPPLVPVINPAPESTDADVVAFLGDGGALSVVLPADQPPEAAADLTITLSVGPSGAGVPVTAKVRVEPHFTLDGAGAAPPGGTVVLTASDGTGLAEAGARPAGIANIAIAAAQATITIDPAAIAGPILLTLAAAGTPTRMARRILTVS